MILALLLKTHFVPWRGGSENKKKKMTKPFLQLDVHNEKKANSGDKVPLIIKEVGRME